MHRRRWFRSPRSAPLVFLATLCLFGIVLTWLCWQLLSQDRQLESQRAQARLEQAADRAASDLVSGIRDLDAWLPLAPPAKTVSPPSGLALLRQSEDSLTVWPAGQFAYLPARAEAGRNLDDVFSAGERVEFLGQDPAAAAAIFRRLAQSGSPEIRAGALLRLARNLRKLGRQDEALGVYGRLAGVGGVAIEGIPADLMALQASCTVLESLGRRAELTKEALLMDAGLRSGRWRLTGAAWDFHRAQARRWADVPALTPGERQALAVSRAAEWLCQLGPHPLEPKGRRVLKIGEGPVLVSWSSGAEWLAAVLVTPDRFRALWAHLQVEGDAHAALLDGNGAVVMGTQVERGRRAVRTPADTGLGATLVLSRSDPAADLANAAIRRRFLLAGFAVLALVLAGGAYFVFRTMARESAVARMQSEFVATVSHEFRTPLTSLLQLSEMLAQDRIPTDAGRRESYAVLFRASQRLQRLVESLLDFGRMEAAAFRYRFDEVDVPALVAAVVEEFRRQAGLGREVVLTREGELPSIRGDREALGVAVWNLLDNAVKYSPDCPTVWVDTRREASGIAIVVRDRGLGIDRREQRRVFERFVRGSAALRSNIKGTGIGLSMARHIARAHGGEIRLDSEPGQGSTFTLFIPIEKTPCNESS